MFAEVEMLHDVAQGHPFGHSGWQYWKLLAVEMVLVSAYKIQNVCIRNNIAYDYSKYNYL